MLLVIFYGMFGYFRPYLKKEWWRGMHYLIILIFIILYLGFLQINPEINSVIGCYENPAYLGTGIFLYIAIGFSFIFRWEEKYLLPRDERIEEIATEMGITEKEDLIKIKFFITKVFDLGGLTDNINGVKEGKRIEVAQKQMEMVLDEENKERIKEGIREFMKVKDSYSIILKAPSGD